MHAYLSGCLGANDPPLQKMTGSSLILYHIVFTGFSSVPVGTFSRTPENPCFVGWAQPNMGNPETLVIVIVSRIKSLSHIIKEPV